MPKIHVSVQNKIARAARRDGSIVCGNTDYEIVFSFDAEWDAFDEKIARFLYGGGYVDVPFRGASCPVPFISNAPSLQVGVYAGELRTTTAALIPCRPSVRSDDLAELKPEAVELYRDLALEAAANARTYLSLALGAAEQAKDHTEQAKEAEANAQSAVAEAEAGMEQLFAEQDKLSSELEALKESCASGSGGAADLAAHAASHRKSFSFIVGKEDELLYMTADSDGVFSESEAYRYNNGTRHTTYCYPLEREKRIASALWHAHLAQQVLLEVSVNSKNWVALQDTAGVEIGSQRYYELCGALSLEDADMLFIRISDSNASDGLGGAILSDVPVTLDVVYGEALPSLLPTVSASDEGAYLRVLGGRWHVAGPEALVSRVYTYSFTVGTSSEGKYLTSDSTGYLNTSCRFNDNARMTIYRYRIANAALVRRVLWTATLGQQLRLECSSNGEDWVLLEDTGKVQKPFTRVTYDLSEHLNLLAFDEVYVRISDSDPSDGFGGAISREGRVDLHVERCEPRIRP